MGPVALTKALLPAMRGAGEGRIVMVSSAGGVRGQPGIAPYSAAKGALERWGESMAGEIAPFGLGVTILVTGTYDTDIITDAGTTDDRNFDGPYARLHNTMNTRGRFAVSFARPPERFTDGLVKALEDRGSFRRRGVGPDASMLLASNRVLPASGMHHMSRLVMGIPRQGAMRGGAVPLTGAQKAMVFAARILPPRVLQRIASLVKRISPAKPKLRPLKVAYPLLSWGFAGFGAGCSGYAAVRGMGVFRSWKARRWSAVGSASMGIWMWVWW
jgi:hypothetical protein